MKKILFVDDEIQILKSLVRLFFDTEFEIFTAENGEEALDVLAKEQIDLIFTDMRMPIMDGYELLSRVKEIYPKVIRIILSGQAEEKLVFKALQQNIARIYLFKPWNNDAILSIVNQVFEIEDILNSSEILVSLNNFEGLPTIQSSRLKIINMIDSDEEISKISREIEQDQAITAQVLRIANSALYGAKTGSIKQAITFLGFKNIRNITQETSIIESLNISGSGAEYSAQIWKHSSLTNKILFYIYEKYFNRKIPELISSAGLLHNIGIVFILKNMSEKYIEIKEECAKKDIDILKLEQQKLKVTHQQIGAYLARWWDLPFPIVEAALFHHEPLNPSIVNKELVIAVHIAQKYAGNIMKIPQMTEFYPQVFDKVNIIQQIFEEELLKENWE